MRSGFIADSFVCSCAGIPAVLANSGAAPDPANWQPANGLLQYSLEVNTTTYGRGTFQIYVRLMDGEGQLAITSVTAKFSGR